MESVGNTEAVFSGLLLNYSLKTRAIDGVVDWKGNKPIGLDPRSLKNGCKQFILNHFVTETAPWLENSSERRKLFEALSPPQSNFSRSSIILNLIKELVYFQSESPSVRLENFRKWRSACFFGDEDLYLSVLWAERFFNAKIDGSNVWQLAVYAAGTWGLSLIPREKDVGQIFGGGCRDAHVHYGQLLPSKIFWILLMQGNYEPRSGSIHAGLTDEEATDDTCGPRWVVDNFVEWRAARSSLIAGLEAAGVPWSSLVRYEKFDPVAAPEELLRPNLGAWENVGNSKLNLAERFLHAERVLLTIGYFLSARGQLAEELYWRYAAARAHFFHAHIPRGYGFADFFSVKGVDAAKGYDWGGAGTKLWFNLVISSLLSLDIRELDVRYTVRLGTLECQSKVRALIKRFFFPFEEAWKALDQAETSGRRMSMNIVMSFSRSDRIGVQRNELAHEGYEIPTAPETTWARRFEGWRLVRKSIAAHLLTWCNDVGGLGSSGIEGFEWKVDAVDMISDERGFDAGIVAPTFRRVLREIDVNDPHFMVGELLNHEYGDKGGRALRRYYHTGEDMDHPISALRTLWETIAWLDLRSGDRLGHVSALCREPENFSSSETLGQRLDNLVWLYEILRIPAEFAEFRDDLRSALGESSGQVHRDCGRYPTELDMISAWQLRRTDEVELAEILKRSDMLDVLYHGFVGVDDDFSARRGDDNQDFARRIYGNRLRIADQGLVYKREWWAAARQIIVREILRRGVDVETCPSSNLLIGTGWRGELPALTLCHLGLGEHLIVGSDDPQMFKTDIRIEAMLMTEAFSRFFGRKAGVRMGATVQGKSW